MSDFLSENLSLNVCFLSILRAFCASNGHEQKPPFYCRLPFIHRGSLNLFYVVKYEAPEFLSKLRESEKVETMGRTARRRQGVFFGRLGVPERSGAGAAGSGRCAVGCVFRRGRGRAVGRARRGARCGAGCRRESRRGVCFSVGGGEEYGRGGVGGRGERRRGQRGWDGCAGISRSPSRFRESPRRDRVRGRRGRARRRSGG